MTATAPPRNRITGRELVELLNEIAAGRTNVAIARRLGVTVETVKGRSRALFRDLGASDRAHAVAIAYQRGILHVPDSSRGQLAELAMWCEDRKREFVAPDARVALGEVVEEIRRRLAEFRSDGAS